MTVREELEKLAVEIESRDGEMRPWYGDSATVPAGFICLCGQHEKFDMYVYAHTHVELAGPCSNCGRRYVVHELVARLEGE